MKKTSICVITEETIPPVQRFSLTLRLAEALGKEYEIHLVAISRDADFKPENVYFHPVKVKEWDLFNPLQRINAVFKIAVKTLQVCRRYHITLIYGGWPVVFIPAFLNATPFIADMPEFIEEMYRAFCMPFPDAMKIPLRLIQTLVAKKSKAVSTESMKALQEWKKRGIKENNLSFSPYGVETDIFNTPPSNKIRQKHRIPHDVVLIMYHGDIGFDDGVDLLIQAVKELNMWCLILGDGPPRYMERLKKNAGPKTIFTGWITYTQIPSYLSSCDIYAAPFRSTYYTNSTFPLKQMEAMAAGKATICSRLTSFSKVVTHNSDIVLVTPGNLTELKEALQSLANNAPLRNKLGENSRTTAREKFDWKTKAQKEITLIKKVLDEL